MMDKKTLFLMLGLGLVIVFAFFYLRSAGNQNEIPSFFDFSSYLDPSSSDSAKKWSFKDLIATSTPTPSPPAGGSPTPAP